MSGELERQVYQPALSETVWLYQKQIRAQDVEGNVPDTGFEQFGEALLEGVRPLWRRMILSGGSYFSATGSVENLALLDLQTDQYHTKFFAMWDFIAYLDYQASLQKKSADYLEELLAFGFAEESNRAATSDAWGSFLREGSSFIKTFMLYVLHKRLLKQRSTGLISATPPEVVFQIVEAMRAHQERELRAKQKKSVDLQLDQAEQAQIIRAVTVGFKTLVQGPLRANGLSPLQPFNVLLYGQIVTLDASKELDAEQDKMLQLIAQGQKSTRAQKPALAAIEIPQNLDHGPGGQVLRLLAVWVERLHHEKRFYKAKRIVAEVEVMIRATLSQGCGTSEDVLSSQIFTSLKDGLRNPDHALGKAIRIRAGWFTERELFSWWARIFVPRPTRTEQHILTHLLHIELMLQETISQDLRESGPQRDSRVGPALYEGHSSRIERRKEGHVVLSSRGEKFPVPSLGETVRTSTEIVTSL